MNAVKIPIHCKGCGRQFGWTRFSKFSTRVYCSAACLEDGDLTPNEKRDDLVAAMSTIPSVTFDDIARYLGVTRQRAYQVVASRFSED